MEKRDNVYEDRWYAPYDKKTSKIRRDNTKHYPNKDEASLLRQIMASTGLSEEEVRSHKKYRKMLSEAQKESQNAKRSASKKWYQDKIKQACKKTGLAPQHPDTIKVLDEILENYYGNAWSTPLFGFDKPNAKTVVIRYAK